MTTFYLVRHGEALMSLADERHLRGGMRELVPLTDLGCDQIVQLSEHLRPLEAEIIISSPMTRAVQSAAILSRLLDLPMKVEFDLRELATDLTYSNEGWADVQEAIREMMALGGEWPPGETRNWEPFSAARQRVRRVLERYLDRQRVIAVSHGGIMVALVGRGLDAASYCAYTLPAEEGAGH